MKSYNHSTVFSGLVIDLEQISDAKTPAANFLWDLLTRSGNPGHA